jgi:deazaflavin-dependent oxidoreductase (nitroreductase family)
MAASPVSPRPPAGIARLLYRAPITLYKLGLGGLLGKRFVLVNHIGRKSRQPRQVVLEVVDYDRPSDTITIVSAWGEKSDWYQNLLQQPEVTIQYGNRSLAVRAEPFSPEASGEAMVSYAGQHPRAAKNLMGLVGYDVSGSDADYRRVGSENLRFVALRPLAKGINNTH